MIPKKIIALREEIHALIVQEAEAENEKVGLKLYNISNMTEYLIKLGLKTKHEEEREK